MQSSRIASIDSDSPSGNVIVLAGQSVFFSGSGSDPDGSITEYSWSFTGGEPDASEDATPGNVTSSTPGTYVVTFTVVDDAGLTATTPQTRTITVLPVPCLILCNPLDL